MSISTFFYTLFFGKRVGKDEFGNRYYRRSKPGKSVGMAHEERWVYYKGQVEASKIPGPWFEWLHFTAQDPPAEVSHYTWEKQHIPNLTGTRGAYFPPGHLSAGGKRDKAIGDYQAWRP